MNDVAGPDSLDSDLRTYLYRVYLETPHDELSFHWVMSLEWLNECRKLDDSTGLTVSAPEYLLGMPIEVREDGGAPHLERR